MRRKLVKQGPSTLTLSMPKEWTARFNLKNGDEVDIEDIDTKLVISSIKKQKSTESYVFDCNNFSEEIMQLAVVSIYRFGLKDMTFINLNSIKMEAVKKIVANSVGLEIIDFGKNSVRVIDIGMPDEETIRKAEQQIYWKLLGLLDKVKENKTSKEEMYLADLEINRLAFFVQRSLSLKFSTNPNTFLEYEKISNLESTGDVIRFYYKNKGKDPKEIEVINKVSSFVDRLRVLEIKFDRNSALEIRHELIQSKNQIDKSKKIAPPFIFLRQILREVGKIHENLFARNITSFKS